MARPLAQVVEVAPRRPRELERAQVVVGDQVGEVLGAVARQALEPLGGEPVRLGPAGARDLGVGDVADEDVPEDERGLAGHGRPALAADELLALEPEQALLDLVARAVAHGRQRPDPEDLAHDGRALEECLLLRRQRVEAGGDDALDGLRAAGSPARRTARRACGRTPRRRAGCRPRGRGAGAARPFWTVFSGEEGERAAARSPRPRAARARRSAALRLPPPQPGRRSSSSGRAVQTTRMGTPEDQSTRWSTKSSRPSSAQCRSSKTSTSGRCSASASKKRRQAPKASRRRSPAS